MISALLLLTTLTLTGAQPTLSVPAAPAPLGRAVGGGFHVPHVSSLQSLVDSGDADVRVSQDYAEDAELALSDGTEVAPVSDGTELTEVTEDFSAVFRTLFEILQEALQVMRLLQEGQAEGAWPALRQVFMRYVTLVQEEPLLQELRQVLPVAQLEEALQRDDAQMLTSAVVQSINPSLALYVFRALRTILQPLVEVASNLPAPSLEAVSELRELIPEPPTLLDITYPLRYAVHRGIAAFQNIFQMRWLGGRSLGEEEYSMNDIALDGEETAISGSSFVMGVGSSILATVVAYHYLLSEDPAVVLSRVRRELQSPLMPSDGNLEELIEVLDAVEVQEGDAAFESVARDKLEQFADKVDAERKVFKKDHPKKFDPLQKLLKVADKNKA